MRDWKDWFKKAGIRAVKTIAQTMLAMLPAAAKITDVDWKTVAGTAALAGVASLLFSIKGIPEEVSCDENTEDLEDSEYLEVEDVTEEGEE